ncbi:site-specific integrase [Pseudaeromonas pectinilytica]
MYLSKNSAGTYYTRITLPKSLRDKGLPFAIRTSLGTKERSAAIDRNLRVAALVRACIASAPSGLTHSIFLAWIRREIDDYKANPSCLPSPSSSSMPTSVPIDATAQVSELHSPMGSLQSDNPVVALGQLQSEFMARKASDGITPRSLQQLKTRTDALVVALGESCSVNTIKFKQADGFIRALSARGLKEKTMQEYKAACSQMLAYGVKMEYLGRDPFEQITIKNSMATPRTRWERSQLAKLFSSENFTQQGYANADDYWIPLILLHTGARPAEICQLQTRDVLVREQIPCLKITNEGDGQSVKTAQAKRLLPIHSKLLELGFLQFVEQRRKQGHKQLFSGKATGAFGEWAKNFETRFSRYLSKLGFLAGQRPTAYGFRHTIIDELQQIDTPEHVVADLVGHRKSGFTFRHYGKETPVERLKRQIEQLNFAEELKHVCKFRSDSIGAVK